MKVDSYETSDVATPAFDENDDFILEKGVIYADARENGKVFLVDSEFSCVTLTTGDLFDPNENWTSDQEVYIVKNLTMST